MTTSLATTIIKAYCAINGRGRLIFRDMLKNGDASYKVTGWETTDYMACAQQLRKAGCGVAIRTVILTGSTRLWIEEPASNRMPAVY